MYKKSFITLTVLFSSIFMLSSCTNWFASAPNTKVDGAVAGSDSKDITAFTVPSQIGATVITNTNSTSGTIAITVPYNYDTLGVIATFTTTGSSVTVNGVAQVSGTTLNSFASPLHYIVTAADSTTKDYTVTLTHITYALRDTGPAGGFIFYINPNYLTDGWKYLEAAPTDQTTTTDWGCAGDPIPGSDGTAMGTGQQDTTAILTNCSTANIAARLTSGDLYSNGFTDWFLPSQDELNKMYVNLRSGTDEHGLSYTPVAAFLTYYWSSSEYDDFTPWAWEQNFDDGSQDFLDKSHLSGVHAVRSF